MPEKVGAGAVDGRMMTSSGGLSGAGMLVVTDNKAYPRRKWGWQFIFY